MTTDRRKELQDWRATLSADEDAVLVSFIDEKGEEYVLSILDYLKESLEIARHL